MGWPGQNFEGLSDILDGGHPFGQAVVDLVAERRIDPVHQEPRSVLDEHADLSDRGL